jgi:hypothetical protein
MDQSLCQPNTLAHTFGEVTDIVVGAIRKIDLFQGFVGAVFRVGDVPQISHELEVFKSCHVIVQGNGFRQVSDTPAYLE